MLTASIHDSDFAAVVAAQEARGALQRIQTKMAKQQLGEAFYDIGPDGTLEIPAFLRRHRDDPPDTTPMPQWIIDANLARAKQTIGKHRPEPTALELEVLAAAEAEHEALTIGKRMAKKAMKEKDAEEKYVTKSRRGKAKEATPDESAPTQVIDYSTHYYDMNAATWRPHGYMSRAKYQRLLEGMPTPAHRKVFIKMFGATQKPEDRDPAPVAKQAGKKKSLLQKLVEGPTAKTPAPKTTAAPSGAARERKLNPEHDAKVSAMLRRPEGATLSEIGAAMGWQDHSASAFLTGIRKTRTIVKTTEARGTVYRLEDTK